MFNLLFKALIFFWPFLKNIVFKDRPIREVIRLNAHVTACFVMLLIVFVSFIFVLSSLQAAHETIQTQREMIGILSHQSGEELETSLEELICTPETPYDSDRVRELLDNLEY